MSKAYKAGRQEEGCSDLGDGHQYCRMQVPRRSHGVSRMNRLGISGGAASGETSSDRQIPARVFGWPSHYSNADVGQTIGFRGLPVFGHRSMFYRRRLPHWIPEHAIVFLTWRLAGSTPPIDPAILTLENTGLNAVRAYDKRLDRSASGPFWLRDTGIASMLMEALQYGEAVRHFYQLYAWAIMPNHVHVILEPRVPFPAITRWLKGRTGRRANQILGRTGTPFWQDESFDRWIRSREELRELIRYVEDNPVTAGLVSSVEQWPWSSAAFGQTTQTDRLLHGDGILRSCTKMEEQN